MLNIYTTLGRRQGQAGRSHFTLVETHLHGKQTFSCWKTLAQCGAGDSVAWKFPAKRGIKASFVKASCVNVFMALTTSAHVTLGVHA